DRMRALALLALAACVDYGQGPETKTVDRKYIAANLLTAVPADMQHVDAWLGGRVEVAGTTAPLEPLVPGAMTKLAVYWHVVVPPGPGWRVLAQLRGEPGTADFMNLDASEMEIGHPVERWLPGEIISDE